MQYRILFSPSPPKKRYKTRDNKYGNFYCRYKVNSNTTYYITFDTEDDLYLVKNIITNHTKEYVTYKVGG